MTITLQDVTPENWRAIIDLSVGAEQHEWVAPNHYSLIEAAYGLGGVDRHLRLAPLAIYAADQPVGFVLYNHGPTRERFFIMRLMIDAAFQGRGYGRTALTQLLALLRAHPQAKEVAISYNRGNAAAQRLYQSCGFVEVPGENPAEIMLWQALNPQPAPWDSLWNPAVRA